MFLRPPKSEFRNLVFHLPVIRCTSARMALTDLAKL